jgi:hypothetical protein
MYIQTTDLMTDYDKRKTRPLVREGAHIDRTATFLNLKEVSGHMPQMGYDTKTD